MSVHNKNGRANDILSEIDKFRLVKEGKVSFRGFELNQHITALLNNVSMDTSIPHHAKRSLIQTALFEHPPEIPLRVQSFEKALTKVESRFLRKKVASYWLRTSVSLSRLPVVQRGAFAGCTYSISKTPEPLYGKELKIYERFGCREGVTSLPSGYSTVWIKATGRSSYDAALNALKAFDTLRGIWNFAVNSHAMRSSFGVSKPINPIVCGPVHFVYDSNREILERNWLHNPEYRIPIPPLNVSKKWEEIRDVEKQVRSNLRGRWFCGEIESCLCRYADALDDTRYTTSFLRLWGILESLTLTKSANYKTTIKRAGAAFSDPWFVRELLQAMREERNEHVHSDRDVEEPELLSYQLKSVIEILIEFWIMTAPKFRNRKEVEDFMDLPGDVKDLKARRRVLEIALKFHAANART